MLYTQHQLSESCQTLLAPGSEKPSRTAAVCVQWLPKRTLAWEKEFGILAGAAARFGQSLFRGEQIRPCSPATTRAV